MSKYKDIHVCVGIPQPEYTNIAFTNALWELLFHSTSVGIKMTRTVAVGSVIARNRNLLVESARQAGATHILQIDADSVFPKESLARLLEHDKDIICATTSRRVGNDRTPVAEPLNRKSLKAHQQLVPMKLIGFPFHLTKMSVFDKLRKPYFADPPRWMVEPDKADSDEIVQEDEYFCKAVIAAGYEIICDMKLSMEVGHLGTYTYYIK